MMTGRISQYLEHPHLPLCSALPNLREHGNPKLTPMGVVRMQMAFGRVRRKTVKKSAEIRKQKPYRAWKIPKLTPMVFCVHGFTS